MNYDKLKTEDERIAYSQGIIARIHGHSKNDNPYMNNTVLIIELYNCWLEGFNENNKISNNTND